MVSRWDRWDRYSALAVIATGLAWQFWPEGRGSGPLTASSTPISTARSAASTRAAELVTSVPNDYLLTRLASAVPNITDKGREERANAYRAAKIHKAQAANPNPLERGVARTRKC